MPKTVYSAVLLIVQAVTATYLIVTTPLSVLPFPSAIVLIIAFAIAAAAFYEMRQTHFRVAPEPAAQGKLVTSGIYRKIRHPMYSVMLIGGLALLLAQSDLVRICAYVVMTVDLYLKARYEEKMLLKHYPAYKDYMKTSFRFIPYFFG